MRVDTEPTDVGRRDRMTVANGAEPTAGEGRRERAAHWFPVAVAGLALVRVTIPLVVLAASGHDLPLVPPYEYAPLNGDSFGFYAAVRELIAAVGRVPPPIAALAVLAVAGATVAARRLWRQPTRRWLALALPGAGLALAACLVIREMAPPGAAVIGWPLVWAVPLAPVRALGIEPTPDVAFGVGLALSLVAVSVATVATACLGVYATGRRAVGLGAAAAFVLWPLAVGPLVGERAWENGQWNVDVGLHLYTEPLSTALVVLGVAMLLRPAAGSVALSGAGLALGFATVVKLTNGLVAVALLPVVIVRHGLRGSVPYAACGLLSAPLVAVFWPKGYVGMFEGAIAAADDPFAFGHAGRTWTESTLFRPWLTLALLSLLAAGAVVVRGSYVRLALLVPIAVTAAVYTFYDGTFVHPRFLFVALPFVFVLAAAGVASLVGLLRARLPHPARDTTT